MLSLRDIHAGRAAAIARVPRRHFLGLFGRTDKKKEKSTRAPDSNAKDYLLSLPASTRDAFVASALRPPPAVPLDSVRDWASPLPLPGAEPRGVPPQVEYHVVTSHGLSLAAGPPDLTLTPRQQHKFRDRAAQERAALPARRDKYAASGLRGDELEIAVARDDATRVIVYPKEKYDELSVISQRSVDYFNGTFTNAPPPVFVPLPAEFRGTGAPGHTLYMKHGHVDVFLLPLDPVYSTMAIRDVDALLRWRRPDALVSQLSAPLPAPEGRPGNPAAQDGPRTGDGSSSEGSEGSESSGSGRDPVPRPGLYVAATPLPRAAVAPDLYASPSALTPTEFEALAAARLNAHWFAAMATEAMGEPGAGPIVGTKVEARKSAAALRRSKGKGAGKGVDKGSGEEAEGEDDGVEGEDHESEWESFVGQKKYEEIFGQYVPPSAQLPPHHPDPQTPTEAPAAAVAAAQAAAAAYKARAAEDDAEAAALLRRAFRLPPGEKPPRLVLAGRPRAVTQSNLSFRYLMDFAPRARRARVAITMPPELGADMGPAGALGGGYPSYGSGFALEGEVSSGGGSSGLGRSPPSPFAKNGDIAAALDTAAISSLDSAHAAEEAEAAAAAQRRRSITDSLFKTTPWGGQAAASAAAAAGTDADVGAGDGAATVPGAREKVSEGATAGTALHECVEVFEPALVYAHSLRETVEALHAEAVAEAAANVTSAALAAAATEGSTSGSNAAAAAPTRRRTVIAVVDHPLVNHMMWTWELLPALSRADMTYLREGYAAAFYDATGRHVGDPLLQASGRAMKEVIAGLREAWTGAAEEAGAADEEGDGEQQNEGAPGDKAEDKSKKGSDGDGTEGGVLGSISSLWRGPKRVFGGNATAKPQHPSDKPGAASGSPSGPADGIDPRSLGLPATPPNPPGNTGIHSLPSGGVSPSEDAIFDATLTREQRMRLHGVKHPLVAAIRDRERHAEAAPGEWGVNYAMSSFYEDIRPRAEDPPAVRKLLELATRPQKFDFFRTFHLDPNNARPWRKVTRLFAQIYGPYSSRVPTCGNCEISEDVNGFYRARCRRTTQNPTVAASLRRQWRSPDIPCDTCATAVSAYSPDASLARFRPSDDVPQLSRVLSVRETQIQELTDTATHFTSSLMGKPVSFATLSSFAPAPSEAASKRVTAAARAAARAEARKLGKERELAIARARAAGVDVGAYLSALGLDSENGSFSPAPITSAAAAARTASLDRSGNVAALGALPSAAGAAAADADAVARALGDDEASLSRTAFMHARAVEGSSAGSVARAKHAPPGAEPFADVVRRYPPVPEDPALFKKYEEWARSLDPLVVSREVRLRTAPPGGPRTSEQALPVAEIIAGRVWRHPVLSCLRTEDQCFIASALARDLGSRSRWDDKTVELVESHTTRLLYGEGTGFWAGIKAFARGAHWRLRGKSITRKKVLESPEVRAKIKIVRERMIAAAKKAAEKKEDAK